MRKRWAFRGVKVLLIALFATAALGFVTMSLWNWLMPTIFGLRAIGFGQAIGLFLLSKILFGGFRGGGGRHMHWKNRMRDRWEQMSPEEREKMREGMRGRWNPFHPPKPETEM